jgi:hypothetical protein
MKLSDKIINDYFCCDSNLKILINWFQCGNKLKKVISWEICDNLEQSIERINTIRDKKKMDLLSLSREKEYLKTEIFNLINIKYNYKNFKIEYSKNMKWLLSAYFSMYDEYPILKELSIQTVVPKIQLWVIVAYLNNSERTQESNTFFRTDFNNSVCNYIAQIVLSENDPDEKSDIFNKLDKEKDYKLLMALYYYCPEFYVHKIINILEKNAALITNNFKNDDELWYHYYLIKCLEKIKSLENTSDFDFESVCISLLKYVNGLNHVSEHGPWICLKNKILSVLEKYTNDVENLSINNLNNLLSNPNYDTILKSFKILETSLGLDSALRSIIQNFNNTYHDYINKDEYLILTSNALKWLNRKDNRILNKLEEVMNGYKHEEQEMARKLMVEIGGKSAMRRLGAREQLKKKYYETMDVAQEKVNKMFESSMKEAKRGFTVAMTMDVMVFLIGFVLMSVSGFMAVFNNDASNWVGIGASGGTGVMSILFSMFYSKPRQQVKDNVNHLMNLKVIFLAYLRELNQLDQSFSQKMIESDVLTENDISFFKQKLNESMSEAVNILQEVKKKNEIPTETTPLVTSASNSLSLVGRNTTV